MTAKSSLNEPWNFNVGGNTASTYVNYFNVAPPCEHIFDVTYGWLFNMDTSLYCGTCGARELFPKMWKIPHKVSDGMVYQRRLQLPTPKQHDWQQLTKAPFQPNTVYDWQSGVLHNTFTKIAKVDTKIAKVDTEIWNGDHTYPTPKLNLDTALKWVNGT